MRRFGVVLATAVTLGYFGAFPAHADTGSTIYVNNGSGSGCSDTDPAAGAQAVPYCTLQTAVDAAQPGETVQVAAGVYPPLHVTHSGTAAQPIVLRGVYSSTLGGGRTYLRTNLANDTPALDIDGASYVSVSQLGVTDGTSTTAVHVHGSSHISLDGLAISETGKATALDIDGSGSTTVTRTRTSGGPVVVRNQAQDTQLLVDYFYESISADAAVVVDGANGTRLRNDTVAYSLGAGVSVRGNASGTQIDDSVLTGSQGGPELSVAPDSTATTSEQYNVLQPVSGVTPYQWGGTAYATQTDFAQATGQGAHDCAGACGASTTGALTESSSAIDSEDPTVTGLPDTDALGRSRVADPIVDAAGGSTGPIDRGAIEFQDPIHELLAFVPDSSGPVYSPATGKLQATLVNPWGDQVTPAQYAFTFGDNSQAVTGTDAQVPHTYQAGLWSSHVTMTSTTGATYQAGVNTQVYAPDPLTTSIDVGAAPTSPLKAGVDVWDSDTSGWSITGRTVNWGDGSPMQSLGTQTTATHTYPRPGAWTVTETSTDDHGRSAQTTQRLVTGSAFVPHSPTRLLDTRTTTGGHHGTVAAGGTISLKVAGVAGIPTSGITAVTLNLTSADPTGPGYLTAYSSSGSRPTASSVNFAAHENRSNLVTVPVGADGRIRIFASTHTDVVADLAGYYRTGTSVPGGTGMLPDASPDRVLDTRTGKDIPVGPGQVVKVHIPQYATWDYTALVLNVTAVSPSTNGYVTVYGSGSVPATSSINFKAGQTTAGQAVVATAMNGTVSIYNHAGNVHLVVDVEGSYDPSAGQAFIPAGPTRLLDTRTSGGPMHNGQQITISNGIPADAKSVLLNLTETQALGSGYLAAGLASSTINFSRGQTSSNPALVNVSNGVTIKNHSQSVQAIADLQGWFG
ncbi:hypothetical protein [Streptacidiphilus monticola]|uniref:PKD domain-containing protein n=1 Tax=Streptacidiphilus monticola TaxID=2161674 RepID=A0ABW1G3F8_9ACTN